MSVGSAYLDLGTLWAAVEDPLIVREVLETFRIDAEARTRGMEAASLAGQPGKAGREAHALKGMALSVGAGELAHVCRRVEGCAKEGNLRELSPAITSLRVCLDETLSAVGRALADLPH